MLLLDRMLKRLVRDGELTVTTSDRRVRRYGRPHPALAPVSLHFTDARTPLRIAMNPAIGAGEAFMDGRLQFTQGGISELLDLVAMNARWSDDNNIRSETRRTQSIGAYLYQLNYRRAAKRNVAHHYDLSDRLYDLFLDADRQYSCAYYRSDDTTLEQAQVDKKAHIAAKLALKPGQKVLDIGCGWGGMALYLNRVADVDVLGVTLSEEQLKVARRRAEEAGVKDRVRFELIDYRDVEGPFDRIVSVGMFEHVGLPNYRTFFRRVRELLTVDGVALLHTIGRSDGPGATDAFTAKYIFPGGYSPALSEIVPAIEREMLWVTDVEVLRVHYGKTLDEWLRRTEAAKAEIIQLYDERFYRMWTFYLAAARGAFRHDGHVNFQIQLTRRRDSLPITRDYMVEAEARYRMAP
ncbi:SAM-dependent methyltransferase [Sphingosinicella microcystinivorans]|uniref:Cyclopropane-fatty-acyl-phospholipid synthase n=1 Tax=Sphingosinicella microcystinivorans TaxID=335406 RepID=A0AAD1G038_SPHMI|nr:cyclopropane-fatty-acyl-phospholipid synthase family protein [Sphingosinicella microcystinivorans]RKS85505.1 cyclopropane-fatty-acyl-phospholipid synthase [Sphingosinicella microcystinivorans]BBE33205.1 replicative DNA helicase [Sphingosinicella microcystinivorans]